MVNKVVTHISAKYWVWSSRDALYFWPYAKSKLCLVWGGVYGRDLSGATALDWSPELSCDDPVQHLDGWLFNKNRLCELDEAKLK